MAFLNWKDSTVWHLFCPAVLTFLAGRGGVGRQEFLTGWGKAGTPPPHTHFSFSSRIRILPFTKGSAKQLNQVLSSNFVVLFLRHTKIQGGITCGSIKEASRSLKATDDHKFLRRKCRNCAFSWQKVICSILWQNVMIYHDMSWFVLLCHDMSWYIWQKCSYSVLSVVLSISMRSFAIKEAPSPLPALLASMHKIYLQAHCIWGNKFLDAGLVQFESWCIMYVKAIHFSIFKPEKNRIWLNTPF